MTQGQAAERLVADRLRAALPPEYRLFSNVAWLGRTAPERGLRDGEADIVLAHPDRGFLVFEVKSGEIQRDAHGRWYAGARELKPSPFDQAMTSMHALVNKLAELPDAPPNFHPIAGHAVALPDVDLASAGYRLKLIGPEIEPDLVFDRAKLPADDPEATCRAVERAFELWAGESRAKQGPGEQGVHLLEEILETPIALRSLLRGEIADGEREVVALTDHQIGVLRRLQRNRRVQIVGAAGTGKTMLAAEKARQLAREGYETLLVCFNQPLARLLVEETAEVAKASGRLTVSTFHQLCEDLAREAGTLPKKPNPTTREWWDETLPEALDDAVFELGPKFHAIVIDEGQDFDADWLLSLEALLSDPKDDVLYVFHDPAQAIYREDAVEGLGLTTFELDENCRNPGPIHEFAMGHAPDAPATVALREEGREVEVIEAEPGAPTLEALRKRPSPAPGRRGRPAVGDRGARRRVAGGFGGLEGAEVRQRGALERPGRRCGEDARAGRGGRARSPVRRDRLRLDPPLQGPREAGDRAGGAAARRRAAGAAALHRVEPGAAAPGRDCADRDELVIAGPPRSGP